VTNRHRSDSIGPADLVVLGGGLGGVAAALAAARQGRRSIVVAESDWLGGQASAQAIPLDEHPWIETVGASHAYRAFRDGIRAVYRDRYPLTATARADRLLNPGTGNIGSLTHEPHVAALALELMLAPWISRGLVQVLRRHVVVAAAVSGDVVTSVAVADQDGALRELSAPYFLDATDRGDLLDLAGVEYVVGAESRAETGELHALDGPADPLDQQPLTWAAVLGWAPGKENVVDRPADYDRWRGYTLPGWPGPAFSWLLNDHVTHRPRERPLFLREPSSTRYPYDLWHARRVLDARQLEGGWEDVTIAAWPMMDYVARPTIGVSPEEVALAEHEARALSLSFVHWMQTEAPRHDGGTGYPELCLRGDVAGTEDGLAKMPYIRESRRLVGELTLVEQHIGVEARPGATGAEPFADSVGVAAYRIDVHPTTGGRPGVDIDTWPFQLPLRAFVPIRVRNVLPAAKNISASQIAGGATRVHVGEWAVGEAAATLAALCLDRGVTPQQVTSKSELVEELQSVLVDRLGVTLAWPDYGALTPVRRVGYVAQEES
jgi:hypothetical protein